MLVSQTMDLCSYAADRFREKCKKHRKNPWKSAWKSAVFSFCKFFCDGGFSDSPCAFNYS